MTRTTSHLASTARNFRRGMTADHCAPMAVYFAPVVLFGLLCLIDWIRRLW